MSEKKVRDPLKQALEGYRAQASGCESLSPEARSAVFRRVSEGERPGALAQLFVPLHRWTALAGASLALVLTVALWNGGRPEPGMQVAEFRTIHTIQAQKVANHLVVTIANGGTEHVVTRSIRPDRFDSSGSTTVQGQFVDRLDRGPDLVFYRID